MNTNSTGFFKRFTKIRGDHPISSIRRLTWKGKIHLGILLPTIAKDKDGKYKKDQNGDFIQRRDKYGELEFPLPDEDREMVKIIKSGGMDLNTLHTQVETLEGICLMEYADSKLQSLPDYDMVNSLLINTIQGTFFYSNIHLTTNKI